MATPPSQLIAPQRASPRPAYDLSHSRVCGRPTAKYDFRPTRTARARLIVGTRRFPQNGGGCPPAHRVEGGHMDTGRFDTLAKTLAQVGTRRSLMGGSLGAAALAALGLG